jgi:hypothetical protein
MPALTAPPEPAIRWSNGYIIRDIAIVRVVYGGLARDRDRHPSLVARQVGPHIWKCRVTEHEFQGDYITKKKLCLSICGFEHDLRPGDRRWLLCCRRS